MFGLFAGAAAAQTPTAGEPDRLVAVRSGPDGKAMTAALPAGAPTTVLQLSCIATADRFTGCTPFSADPPGRDDVAQAAIGLAQSFRLEARDRSGKPIAGRRFAVDIEMLAPGDKNADWLRKPTREGLAGAYPLQAAKAGKDGVGMIACKVSVEGLLNRCRVVGETPEGYGFGEAALQLAPLFAMTPKIRGGKPVEGEVTIPLRWSGMRGGLPSKAVMSDPDWTKTPSEAALKAAYPEQAAKLPAGFATLNCDLTEKGEATRCTVVSESPVGRGFGKAALTLAPQFAVAFDDASLLSDMRIEVPLHFRNPAMSDDAPLADIRFTQTLSAEGAARLFPVAAKAEGVATGLGVVSCLGAAGGALGDCRIVREEPAGKGFGPAALEAAKAMRLNPWTKRGDPVEGRRVTLPIRLNLEP